MKPGTRACIAYIAGRASNGSAASHIYDYQQSKYISFTGTVTGDSVAVYDYDRGCYCSGTFPQVYDYGDHAHISLEMNDTGFRGYDYGSGHHFSGTVNGAGVSIYDYGESKYFSYTL